MSANKSETSDEMAIRHLVENWARASGSQQESKGHSGQPFRRTQRGEILRGKARIAKIESHFRKLKLGVTRRH